jgi:hypothetical protein
MQAKTLPPVTVETLRTRSLSSVAPQHYTSNQTTIDSAVNIGKLTLSVLLVGALVAAFVLLPFKLVAFLTGGVFAMAKLAN